MFRKLEDLKGQVFGKLTVKGRLQMPGFGGAWVCQCACGNEITVRTSNLKRGNTKSCGCLRRQKKPITRFRPSRKGDTKLSWELMIGRCYNSKSDKFKDYGGRGIKVCARWLDYKNFLADMGPRPAGTTLDRKDNDKNYEPKNCRWATAKQQANNRRDTIILEAFGKKQSLRTWAEEYKMPSSTLYGRLNKHTVEEALTLPLYGALRSPEAKAQFYRNRKSSFFIEAFGQRKTLVEWSEQYGIRSSVLSARIRKRGMTPEQALTTPMMNRGRRHLGMKAAVSK
jgi:hypothetical protein